MQQETKNPTILIGHHDSRDTQEAVTILSEVDDYTFLSSNNGDEVLEMYRKNRPDLILLDLLLPGLDGFEICELVRKDLRYTPVIAITMVPEQSQMLEVFEIGADDFINKPFDPHCLRGKVKAMLRIKVLYNRLHSQLMAMTKSFVKALELKDVYTRGHSERVADMTLRMCQRLPEMKRRQISVCFLAALVHDIGKLMIDDAILNKPSSLSNAEYDKVKQHPIHAAKMLGPIEEHMALSRIIRHHHERWDGRGYPDGLEGEAIPLESRIIGIADTFDALTSRRANRPAMSVKSAMKVISKEGGRQLDPDLLDTFAGIARETESWQKLLAVGA